jgi:hypothetical protein
VKIFDDLFKSVISMSKKLIYLAIPKVYILLRFQAKGIVRLLRWLRINIGLDKFINYIRIIVLAN